jgi:DNA-binding NarL/FixJ family response regulator
LIRILLCEDQRIVRDGLNLLLGAEKDFQIAGLTETGSQVLNKLNSGLTVDVLLMDKFQKVPGKTPNVLIFSIIDNEKYVQDALKAGALGYILKSASTEELIFAIRQVASGKKYISTEISLSLLNKSENTFQHDEGMDSANAVRLSKREREVLSLMAQGLTNKEISERLFTSRRTVEGHRRNLIEKTGSVNTATLIKYAIKKGII